MLSDIGTALAKLRIAKYNKGRHILEGRDKRGGLLRDRPSYCFVPLIVAKGYTDEKKLFHLGRDVA